ncbi:Calphotin [Candidatus Terasakiella magnetica]|nr:Calphotin [Candidatus Terasakiella magnetica]
MAEATSISAGANPLRTQAEWESAARDLLEEGQNFLAHDFARAGLKLYPESFKLVIFGAVALSQTGAVDEARKLLQPVLDVILIDEGPFHRLHTSLKKAVDALSLTAGKETLATMAELAEAFELVRGKKLVATADSETYTALAGVFREAWLASGSHRDLEHCRDLYLRAFHIGHAPRDGIDAAVSSWLLNDHEGAHDLACKVRDQLSCAESEMTLTPEERYGLLSTLAAAHLLLGETDEAIASFEWASTLEGVHYGIIVSALKQLALLQEGGLEVPPRVFDIIKPPTVVVFTGHPLDRPGEGPHFPPDLEAAVRGEIAHSLDELGAQVGYSMAACGSDLLFIEAMLERGAEVNVVMPYAIEDFIAENVRYGGSRWEMRFRNALKLANTVTYATEERYLGHGMLYRFANQCLHGLATLRANFLRTAPYLLAVWDMMPGSLVGGAADFIDQWEDISQLRIIDLDSLLQQHPDLAGDSMPSIPELDLNGDEEVAEGRVIRSMMFCDIAGYSKLKEEHVPVFLDFLRILNDGMAKLDSQPIAVNTWGDAIFAVMTKATAMAEYAQTLQEMVLRADEALADRLPHPLNLRISLHAGPVFQAEDPICGRQNFYGSHINRAARLEPVTVIGHVYATQQFVAVLTAEQSAMRSEAQNRGEAFEERFACEYVGVLSLAKDFGKQTVYHLRRRGPPPALSLEERAEDEDESAEAEAEPADHTTPETLQPPAASETDLLAEIPDTPEPAPHFGAIMSDSDMDSLLAESEDSPIGEEPEETPPPPLPGVATAMSDADIMALLEEVGEEEHPVGTAPTPPAFDLGSTVMSEDDMARLLEEAVIDDGEPEDARLGSGIMSDADIMALLEEAEEENIPPVDSAPAVSFTGIMSDDDMASLLAEAEPLEELEPEPEPPPLDPEMAEVAAAVERAMAKLEAEDAAKKAAPKPLPVFHGRVDIHLAPPKPKPPAE